MKLAVPILSLLLGANAFAQLAAVQRLHDFRNLAALYAKRYAPYDWKKQVSGFDLFELSPWLTRVERAQTDIEFLSLCAEYVARLDDVHSSFRTGSGFSADAGFYVDIYDGKPLVESINRARLPQALFPFQIGDEVVSVDGMPADEFIAMVSKYRRMGNPLTTRRNAADWISFRPQSLLPIAPLVGETSRFEFRRASGDIEAYDIPWLKNGVPLLEIGPTLTARSAGAAPSAAAPGPVYPAPPEDLDPAQRPMWEHWNWAVPVDDPLFQGATIHDVTGEQVPRRYLLGLGSRFPVWSPPAGFQIRLGLRSTDFHFSGVYTSGGKRIGYLRFPGFSPSNLANTVAELAQEIAYMQANTDGLVVDVMRNPGGGCYMLNAASYLIPQQFYFFGEYVRPTFDRIQSMAAAINALKAGRADGWIIALYQAYLGQIEAAYREVRGMTGAIPACSVSFENEPARDALGNVAAYTKPMIILIDEFSISAGDIFPAMLQDNRRGPLVGTRTSGAGGSVSGWPVGFYSEVSASNTNTLVIRKNSVTTDEYPSAPFIENIGARADIHLDYMTRENLLNQGRPFVEAFTRVILDEIAKAQ
jgi:hypothetical protein